MRPSAHVFVVLLSVAFTVGAFAQTFNSPPLLSTAFDPVSVATGDFNHDGNPDLVYVDGSGQNPHTLHVLLGRGNGSFAHGQDVALPPGICLACTINVADVTGDGLPDLILEGNNTFTGAVAVLLGNGDGTFQAPIVSTVSPNTQVFSSLRGVIAVADFNGDGSVDLAVGEVSQGGGIHILLGNKTGSFVESAVLVDNTLSSDLHAIDLNHDGHIDLVALGGISTGGFNVYFGNGDGTFQFPVLHEIGPGFKGYLANLDGDGQLDVLAELTPIFNVKQIIFIKGNPDGTFNAPVVLGTPPFNVVSFAIGDFNGDGLLDLEVANQTGIGILLGQPGLTFGPIITSLSPTPNPFFSVPPVQADLNKDGHLDLALPADGGIVLLMGKGDGTFETGAQVYDVGNPVSTIAVADFNSDKLPDIAVAVDAATPRLLLGQPDGTFVLAPDPNTSHQFGPGTLAAGDFNGDGHTDLALGLIPFAASPTVLFGDGHGNFSVPVNVPTASPDVADFNNDGRSDMAVVNISIAACFTGCKLTVSLGQTNNTFVTQETSLLGITDANFTAIGDLNGDGIPDVVTVGDGVLEVWLGKGDGTFSQGTRLNIGTFIGGGTGLPTSSAALVDLDGDGRKDLVLAPVSFTSSLFFPAPQAFMVLYGLGDGTFEPPVLIPLSHYYNHLTVSDLNQDGHPDLIFNDGVGIAVILNLGSRTFEDESHYVAGTSIAGLTAVDVNGDGFPDLVVANAGGQTVAVLLNNPTGILPGGLHPLLSVSITSEPSDFAAPFTATASVAAPNLTSPAPSGSVDFFLDGSLAATVPLSSGTASFTFTASLTPGVHRVVATYSGDSAYSIASANQQHTVNRPVFTTQTVLTAAPLTALASQTVHLETTVSAAGGATVCPPVVGNLCSWGTVIFSEGTTPLHVGPADTNGRAVFDTALLAPGTHAISTRYLGFSNSTEVFPQSTSAPVTVTVNSGPTTTNAAVSNSSITAGSLLTISATVSSASGTPFGSATFFDGAAPLGTVSLHADGGATFSTASLSAGTHLLSARFNTNAIFGASSSASVPVVVQPPAAALIPTFTAVSTISRPDNGTFSLAVTVAAERGSPLGPVVFLDGGLVVGKATTDSAGTAAVTIPQPGSGPHIFHASFSGDTQFAPSVSPELEEIWPDSGATFSMAVSPGTMSFSGVGAEGEVSVATTGALLAPVQLACVSGVPSGYSCNFEPFSLSGNSVSRLSIRRSVVSRNARPLTPASRIRSLKAVLLPIAIVSVSLVSVVLVPRGRRSVALVVLCCIALGVFSGCGSEQRPPGKLQVVTVQATSGTAQSRSVHSTQIILLVSER